LSERIQFFSNQSKFGNQEFEETYRKEIHDAIKIDYEYYKQLIKQTISKRNLKIKTQSLIDELNRKKTEDQQKFSNEINYSLAEKLKLKKKIEDMENYIRVMKENHLIEINRIRNS
jgi:glutaredoxin 2